MAMIITEYIEKRGKQIKVADLSRSSSKKIQVQCPVCEKVREVLYKSLTMAGHHVCLKCKKNEERIDLQNESVFGMLTIISPHKKAGFSNCKCECGNICITSNRNLTTGTSRSCGCLKKRSFDGVKRAQGNKHGGWQGGKSSKRQGFSSLKVYKEWRRMVFERDHYQCISCSAIDHLQTHHIIEFEPTAQTHKDITNGITLCVKCHNKFHSQYGKKGLTIEMMQEFLTSIN